MITGFINTRLKGMAANLIEGDESIEVQHFLLVKVGGPSKRPDEGSV